MRGTEQAQGTQSSRTTCQGTGASRPHGHANRDGIHGSAQQSLIRVSRMVRAVGRLTSERTGRTAAPLRVRAGLEVEEVHESEEVHEPSASGQVLADLWKAKPTVGNLVWQGVAVQAIAWEGEPRARTHIWRAFGGGARSRNGFRSTLMSCLVLDGILFSTTPFASLCPARSCR